MNAPRVEFLESSLGFNLYRVAQLFRRELMRALASDGLTPEQWQILVALEEHCDGRTQSELAALTLKDRHALSRTLERMERDGWIRRRPHPVDARASAVELANRRRLPGMRRGLLEHFEDVHALLSRSEQRVLLRLLRKLRAGLESGSTRAELSHGGLGEEGL
jgi:MarR family transcriptional regulator, lower aerobic nicotinate degradation pathway regulator